MYAEERMTGGKGLWQSGHSLESCSCCSLTYASFGHLRLLRRNPLWLNQGIYLLHCPELLHDAQHACGYPCWGGQQTIQRPFNRLDDSKTNATHALCLLIHLGYYFRRPPRICCWTHTHTHFHDLLLMSWAGSNLTFSSKLQFQLLVLKCHSRAPSQSKSLRPIREASKWPTLMRFLLPFAIVLNASLLHMPRTR